ncbi:MAG: SET domain-containing protein-lysine N-methyltransferase [Flavobacteriales bacterium]|nr:SET domain-containing protein-lysine N-methyltransferase [Flavobacteriales bacterium]
MKTPPNTSNSIEALETDYLYTDLSQIAGSGNGLFTAIDIFKDETVAVFAGELLSEIEAKKRADVGNDRYFITLENGRTFDSMRTPCFAKYANDAQGPTITHFKNNARIALDENYDVCIRATRNIRSGEELFCGYGKRYWRKHGFSEN